MSLLSWQKGLPLQTTTRQQTLLCQLPGPGVPAVLQLYLLALLPWSVVCLQCRLQTGTLSRDTWQHQVCSVRAWARPLVPHEHLCTCYEILG